MQPMKFIHMRPDPGQGLGGITICYRAQLDPKTPAFDETICRQVMEFAVFRHTGQRITIV